MTAAVVRSLSFQGSCRPHLRALDSGEVILQDQVPSPSTPASNVLRPISYSECLMME